MLFGSKRKNTKNNQLGGSKMQEYINISEIKDGVVVLKDGSLRAVLAVSSINFDLKSTTEQEAIIIAFQRFLNTLDFSIQILISTRRFDIKPYLRMLEEKKDVEINPLLREQIADYSYFVGNLVEVANITAKAFYVVVPFYVFETKEKGFFEKLAAGLNRRKEVFQKREEFETNKNQLFQRVDEIKEAMSGTGVRMTPLDTQELIEMFYNFYNPSEFEHVTLAPVQDIRLD